MYRVLLAGRIDDAGFQRARAAARWAEASNFITLELSELFEFEWDTWRINNKSQYNAWEESINHIVAINGDADEDYQDFYSFCEEKFKYEESEENDYSVIANDAKLNRMKNSNNMYCFLKFRQEGEIIQPSLTLELYKTDAPKTCKNFKNLCEAEGEDNKYKGTYVHRIVPNGWIQMGDTKNGSKGDSGHSSFEKQYFPDETFSISHNARGMVGMANSGPHSNQSQFYITLEAKKYLDKKYVCFGKVIEGTALLDLIERVHTFNERPVKPIEIAECGVIKL